MKYDARIVVGYGVVFDIKNKTLAKEEAFSKAVKDILHTFDVMKVKQISKKDSHGQVLESSQYKILRKTILTSLGVSSESFVRSISNEIMAILLGDMCIEKELPILNIVRTFRSHQRKKYIRKFEEMTRKESGRFAAMECVTDDSKKLSETHIFVYHRESSLRIDVNAGCNYHVMKGLTNNLNLIDPDVGNIDPVITRLSEYLGTEVETPRYHTVVSPSTI